DDLQLLAGALDVDVRHRRVRRRAVELLVEMLADLLVLDQQLAVQRLGRVPAGAVGLGDAEPKSERVRLLSHQFRSCTETVMWLVRWRMGWARPRSFGRNRLMCLPSSTLFSLTNRLPWSAPAWSASAIAASSALRKFSAARFVEKRSMLSASIASLPRTR